MTESGLPDINVLYDSRRSCVRLMKLNLQKGLDHCGQCDDFPCAILSGMGKEMGFDPSIKIAQCRTWLKEEKQS